MMPEANPVAATTPLAEENARLRRTIHELHLELAKARGQEPGDPCAICVDEPRIPGMLVCSSCRHAQAGSMLHDSLASEVAMLRRQVAALEAELAGREAA